MSWDALKKKAAEAKEAARKALHKVEDVMAHPYVQNATSIANGALDIAAKLGQAHLDGRLATAGAVLGIADIVRQNLTIDDRDPIEEYLTENPGLEPRNSSLPVTLFELGVFDHLAFETAARNDYAAFLVMQDSQGEKLGVKVGAALGKDDKKTPVEKVERRPESTIWHSPNFDFRAISDAMWKVMEGPVAKLAGGGGEPGCRVISTGYDTIPYVGKHRPKAFADTINFYHQRGISRGVLLFGPPGSGKTTFVRAYARHIRGRLLVIPPDVLGGYARQDIELFTELLRPDILLLDDIDRAANGLPYAMDISDFLRRKYPKMVLATTCNQLSGTNAALLRPGRLGEKLEFLAPDRQDKIEILRLYLKEYDVDEKKLDVDALVDAMDHEGFTHDYVRFVAEQAVVMDQSKLLVEIANQIHCLELIDEWIEPMETLARLQKRQPFPPRAPR